MPSSAAARTAPATISPGALSPPIASTAMGSSAAHGPRRSVDVDRPGGRGTSRSCRTRRAAAWPRRTAGRRCGPARRAPHAAPDGCGSSTSTSSSWGRPCSRSRSLPYGSLARVRLVASASLAAGEVDVGDSRQTVLAHSPAGRSLECRPVAWRFRSPRASQRGDVGRPSSVTCGPRGRPRGQSNLSCSEGRPSGRRGRRASIGGQRVLVGLGAQAGCPRRGARAAGPAALRHAPSVRGRARSPVSG